MPLSHLTPRPLPRPRPRQVTHFVLLGNAAGKENAESSAAHRRALVMQSSGKPLQIVDLEWVEKQCCKEVAPTHDVSTRGKRTLQNPAVQQPTSTASSSSSPSTKKVKRETNERETVRTEEVKRETKMVKAYLKGRVVSAVLPGAYSLAVALIVNSHARLSTICVRLRRRPMCSRKVMKTFGMQC